MAAHFVTLVLFCLPSLHCDAGGVSQKGMPYLSFVFFVVQVGDCRNIHPSQLHVHRHGLQICRKCAPTDGVIGWTDCWSDVCPVHPVLCFHCDACIGPQRCKSYPVFVFIVMQVEDHRDVCPVHPVDCKFKHMGCKFAVSVLHLQICVTFGRKSNTTSKVSRCFLLFFGCFCFPTSADQQKIGLHKKKRRRRRFLSGMHTFCIRID